MGLHAVSPRHSVRRACGGCGRKAGTIVEVEVNHMARAARCYGCIADLRLAGALVKVLRRMPAAKEGVA